MKEVIGLYSSLATLILFVFYFVGRIITLCSVRRIWKDKVIFGVDDENAGKFVVDYVTNCEDEGESTRSVLVSKEGIRNLKVYKAATNKKGIPTRKGKLIYKKEFLNIDEAIVIDSRIGDLFPTLIVEYNSFDYMKVKLEWKNNKKNGVYSEMVVLRHTLKSFFYYLFR